MEFATVTLLALVFLALLTIVGKLSAIARVLQDTSSPVDGIHQEALTTKDNVFTATNYLEDIVKVLVERGTLSKTPPDENAHRRGS